MSAEPSEAPKQAKPDGIPLFLVLVGVIFAFFWRWWIQGPRIWEDALDYGWPTASILAEHLARFKLAMWDPYSFGGDTWLGPPIYGNFYFGQIVLVVAVWLTGAPLSIWAYAIWLVLHYVAAGAGMWILVRKLKQGISACLFAGIAYSLSFPLVVRFKHSCYLIALAWLPLLCWLAVRFVEKPTWRRAAVLGVSLGCVFLGTAPQYSFYLSVAIGLVILFSPAGPGSSRAMIFRRFAGSYLIAVGIACATLLYQFQYADFCGRLDSEFQLVRPTSSPWWVMARAFFPRLTGRFFPETPEISWGDSREFPGVRFYEAAIFPGLVVWAGVALYLVSRGWRDRASWPWLALTTAGILWSAGAFNPLRIAIRLVIQPLASTRFAIRGWALAELGLVVLAVYGFSRFAAARSSRSWAFSGISLLAGCFAAAVLTGIWRFTTVPPPSAQALEAMGVFFYSVFGQGLFIAAIGLIYHHFRAPWKELTGGVIPAQLLLTLLLCIELFFFGSRLVQGDLDPSQYYSAPITRKVGETARAKLQRVDAWGLFELNFAAARLRVPSLQGYSTMRIPLSGEDFIGGRAPRGPELDRRLDLYGVGFAFRMIGKDLVIITRPTAFPKAWFCHKAEIVPFEETLTRIDSPDLDLRRTVLFTPEDRSQIGFQQPLPSTSATTQVAVKSYLDNEVVLEVFSASWGWVVLNDNFAPGWNCTVDGLPSEILRADGVFRAVAVTPGRHVVRFWYWPGLLSLGLLIGGAAISLAVVLMVRGTPLGHDMPHLEA